MEPGPPHPDPAGPLASPSDALASQRTAMAIERTFMAADRTLMAIIRTALSMISFGFTIFTFFGKLAIETNGRAVTSEGARHFGFLLVLLGIGLLAAGLISHYLSFLDLRRRRAAMHASGLLRTPVRYRTTPTAVTGLLLLLLGVAAACGMILRLGPMS